MMDVAMTLRLTEEQERALALLAEADGVSKHEAAVRAITDVAARRVRDDRVAALSSEGRRRYASLLDRLAQ
jgi:predicted transcriptional regulator